MYEGLQIVGVGITGVFVNLFVLMLVIVIVGKLFGKKPKKKTGAGEAKS